MQTKNKTVFIPDKAHKQNLPPYQHKVYAPIWNISHIVSSFRHCGLQRNDQYRTYNQRLVPHLFPSNRLWKEQLGQCPNLMECQTEMDPGKPFSSIFFEGPRRTFDADWFWIYWPVLFSFSELPQQIFCKVFSLLFHHEDLALGSGLAQGWYLIIGEPQQKWMAKN